MDPKVRSRRTSNGRGAEDDGMTNGIWHAMHTADKGEDALCTLEPFMGNSNSSFEFDAKDFLS